MTKRERERLVSALDRMDYLADKAEGITYKEKQQLDRDYNLIYDFIDNSK